MKKIAVGFFVPPFDGGTFAYDTRTEASEILGHDFDRFMEVENARTGSLAKKPRRSAKVAATKVPTVVRGVRSGEEAESDNSSTSESMKPTRPDSFFESLTCTVQDQNLTAIVHEIKSVKPKMKISGTYLLRVLTERALEYQIEKSGLVERPKDDSLSAIVNFCIQNRGVFAEKRARDILEICRKQHVFDYLNIVVHQKWMNADEASLISTANQLRPLLAAILNDRA